MLNLNYSLFTKFFFPTRWIFDLLLPNAASTDLPLCRWKHQVSSSACAAVAQVIIVFPCIAIQIQQYFVLNRRNNKASIILDVCVQEGHCERISMVLVQGSAECLGFFLERLFSRLEPKLHCHHLHAADFCSYLF